MGKGGVPRKNASAAPPATPAKKAKLAPGKDDTPVEGGKGSGPPTQATLDRAVYKTIRDVFAELSCWAVKCWLKLPFSTAWAVSMAKGNAVGQKTACKRPPATPAKKPKLAPGKDNTFKD